RPEFTRFDGAADLLNCIGVSSSEHSADPVAMARSAVGDGEAMLRRARRPLVLGIGGGGDVVGALATAEHARIYDGAEPMLGGVLARGDEPGLRSPLCDAIMLAVASRMRADGHPVLAGIFGIGCDAELTPSEVLARLAAVAGEGGLAGARGLTAAVADRLEQA